MNIKLKNKQRIIIFLKNKKNLAEILFLIYDNFLKKKKYRYFDEGNIVLHNHKVIYFPIPKVASSSLKKIFSELLNVKGEKKLKGKSPEYYNFREFPYVKKRDILKKYDYYFKFTFVRNPYDRIVSCYDHWISGDITNNNFKVYKSIKKGMAFKEFVKAVSEIPDHISDGHFKSQHIFIQDKKGNLLVNFIGKVENLEIDFKEICKKSNLPFNKLPHINKKSKKNYKDYYDEETKQLIYERYKKDFELFGYSKEF